MAAHIRDICPDFLTFWDRACGQPLEEQERLWRALYEAPHQDIFESYFKFFGDRRNLRAALGRYESVVPTLRVLAPAAAARIQDIAQRCARLFEALEIESHHVLMVGVFDSDSWSTTLDGKPTAFLAMELEENARLSSIEITAAHETAHGYHKECRPASAAAETLGAQVFAEGLAILASALLVPGAPEAAYLCPGGEKTRQGQPCAEWVADCDRCWPRLRRHLLDSLDREDAALTAAYFFTNAPTIENIPRRAGYVAGYRVVHALAQTYTVAEMARWAADRAVGALRGALDALPGTPDP